MTEVVERLRRPEERAGLAREATVLGGGILGGVAARRLLTAAWERSRAGGEPPLTPGPGGPTWKRALVWAVSSGLAVGVSRMVSRRLAAGAIRR